MMRETPTLSDYAQDIAPRAEEQPAASYLAPCKPTSFSPELLDFYGDSTTILNKIDNHDLRLGDRRVYFLLVESATSAEVRFFERVSDELVAVFSWSGTTAGDLKSRINEAILANRGINCIGEQLKKLISDRLEVRLEGTVPAPVSPRAAFAHTIRNNDSDGYLRATAALLC
jgi:hypothetical protein